MGVVTITFRETELPAGIARVAADLNTVKGATHDADRGTADGRGQATGHAPEPPGEYFRTYSNGITWPKILMMPDENTAYQDPHFYGYYCEYDYCTTRSAGGPPGRGTSAWGR